MSHRLLSSALLIVLLTSCSSEPPRARELGTPAAAPRESLSREARKLLSARMQRHGEQMNTLVGSVITLDWPAAQHACAELIDEPAIAPPLSDQADSFNAQLPPSFFVHQRSLLEAVRTLHAAAAQQDDHASKAALNGVVAACIDCHSAYLEAPARPDLLGSEPALR